MPDPHRLFDHALFALLLAIPLLERCWVWPRFLSRLASGVPHMRVRFYRTIVLGQWLIALALIAYWSWRGRPWTWLLLGPAAPLRLAIGLAFALLFAGFLYWQRVQVLRRENAIAKVRPQLESATPLLPHTCTENRLFKVVAVTAGVCEEVIFRGFLLWYLGIWTGPVAAAFLSSLVFGFGHLYLGRIHVVKTSLAGLLFACVVQSAGSLWPAIFIHAAMDWNSGELGYRILTRPATLA